MGGLLPGRPIHGPSRAAAILEAEIAEPFEIDNLVPELRGVSLDYRDYDGQAVRTHFRFSPNGKITHTACSPVAGDGTRPMAA
jgi:hypothetical protein